MTKILWQCDRCGKLTELEKKPRRHRLLMRILPLEPHVNYMNGYDEAELGTVCDTCWEEVHAYIKGGTHKSGTKEHVESKRK